MMKKLLSTSLVALMISTNAYAGYTTYGSKGCGQFVDDYMEDGLKRVVNKSWIAGFLTGYNYSGVSKNIQNEIPSMELAVFKYCKENPLADTHDALIDSIAEITMTDDEKAIFDAIRKISH